MSRLHDQPAGHPTRVGYGCSTRTRGTSNPYPLGRVRVLAGYGYGWPSEYPRVYPCYALAPTTVYQPRQPTAYDPNAMDTSAAVSINQASSTNAPRRGRAPVQFDPADSTRVLGDRAALMAAGACYYCKRQGHMKASCPLLANAPVRSARGAYTPLSRPGGTMVRSLDTNFTDQSRVVSPVPSYAASASQSFSSAAASVVDDNDPDFPRN
jgi:hypothetical protein